MLDRRVHGSQGIWDTRKWKKIKDFNSSCYGLRTEAYTKFLFDLCLSISDAALELDGIAATGPLYM